jgi:hypothetical protein
MYFEGHVVVKNLEQNQKAEKTEKGKITFVFFYKPLKQATLIHMVYAVSLQLHIL